MNDVCHSFREYDGKEKRGGCNELQMCARYDHNPYVALHQSYEQEDGSFAVR